jgi:WD40 repeat protein/tRNA A-37 threonylcarbamoyl transferase component Bud32
MSACPSLQELEDLAAGRTDGASATEQHVEACAVCGARLREIRINNALLAELASVMPTPCVSGAAPAAAAPPPHRPHPPHSFIVDGYELLEPIGQGSQGTVYKAVQTATKRVVAIKFLLAGRLASQRQRGRFDREVELAAALRHPNIVTVFDSGTSAEGRHFCAMEFVDGAPLGEYLSSNRLSVQDTLRLFTRICSAVEYAHLHGIIHRDLKPANVLIDRSGEPRVVDFGLAKLAGSAAPLDRTGMTRTGEFAGTFAYASPEQTQGDPQAVDARTDVYSLGVILFEMLTGELPYHTTGALTDVLRAITQAPPRAPSGIRAEIDEELETILYKALAKEPERRYQSAGELARDVEHYLQDEPIDAKRDSAMYMLRKAVRRHRLPFGLGVAALLILVGFAIAMSVAYRRASIAEHNEAARSSELAELLAASNIERGRAHGQAGNAALAEQILWNEYFNEARREARRATPTSVADSTSPARWALWELYSAQPCLSTVQLAPLPSLSTFTLADDGRTGAFVVRGSPDIELWDVSARRHLDTLATAGGTPCVLAFSRGGGLLACGTLDGQVRLWDLVRHTTASARCADLARIRAVVFSEDGARVAAGTASGLIRVWRTEGLEPEHELQTSIVSSLALSPDGRRLASGGVDGTVHLWDTTNWTPMPAPPVHSTRAPIAFAMFSPDGRWLAVVGDELGLWSVPDLQTHRQLTNPTGTVTAFRFSPDGSLVVVGSTDRSIQLWSLASNEPTRRTYSGHTGPVTWLSFVADGATLVSQSIDDGTIRRWDAGPTPWAGELGDPAGHVQSACYSADGAWLALAGTSPGIQVWDVTRKKLTRSFPTDSPAQSVSISASGVLAAGLRDGSIEQWDLGTGTRRSPLREHASAVNSVAFSLDGAALASTSQDGTLRIWDASGGRCRFTSAESHEPLSRVCFSPNGELIAAGGKKSNDLRPAGSDRANLVHVWDARSGALLFSLAGHGAPVRTVCFAPDGRSLASGSDDQTVRIWDLAGRRCIAVLPGHRHAVFGLSYRGDGKLLASAGGGGELKLWDVPHCRNLANLSRDTETVFGLHLSADGRWLSSWGNDKLVTLWDLARFDRCIDGNEAFWRERQANPPSEPATGPGGR